MENIKFIGRERELEELKNIKGNFFLVVKGRRRIGKTLLLRKAFPDATYIFIWPDKSMDWICQEVCKENNLPEFKNFKDILTFLLDKNKTVIIDEFQNFLNIDKSVFGEIQKIIDERKMNKSFFKIAVAGSSYSLMNKVFNDSASPLYGRRTNEIVLDNLPIMDLFNEIKFPLADFIKLWAVFEGVPYYYELIDRKESSEENIKRLVMSRDAQLKEEGKVILSVEFGRDSKTYNTIISAIADGKTKLNEISSLFGNKKQEVIKYLDTLRNDFRLVRKLTPLTEDPKRSREGRYEILDNFLSFWFFSVDRLRGLIEQERYKEVEERFNLHFGNYMGRKFEKFISLLVMDGFIFQDEKFDKVGGQWGKFEGEKGKNVYEIDLVCLNEKKRKALFVECKWKDNIDARVVAEELIKKSKFVKWNLDERKESYAIFAKSFKKKISEFEGKKVYCYDLKDLEKAMKDKL